MTILFFRSFDSICTSGFSLIAIIFFSFTAFIYPQDITGDIEGQTTDSKGKPSLQKAVDSNQYRFNNLDETDTNPNYGQVKSYQPSMSLRLGMEVSF